MFLKNLCNKPVFYYDPDGGGSGGGNTPPAAGNGAGGGETKPPETRSFTQAELDAMFSDRAKRAEENAIKTLLEKAGAKDATELLATLEEGKKAKTSQMSELEKLQAKMAELEKKATDADNARTAALAQANERLLKGEVLAAAAAKGFRPEAVNDVWLVIDRSKITEKDGAFAGVEAAIEQVVKDKPFWLGEKAPGKGTPPPKQTAKQPATGNQPEANRPRLRL